MDYIKNHTDKEKTKFLNYSTYILDFVDMTNTGSEGMNDFNELCKVLIPIRNKIYQSMEDTSKVSKRAF